MALKNYTSAVSARKSIEHTEPDQAELYGVEPAWGPQMQVLLALLDELRAGKIVCRRVENTKSPDWWERVIDLLFPLSVAAPDVYGLARPIYKAGRHVGWFALWGDSPRYLLADHAKHSSDPEAWMDETLWRRLVGGTPGDFVVKEIGT
jgi:hypothetical protein